MTLGVQGRLISQKKVGRSTQKGGCRKCRHRVFRCFCKRLPFGPTGSIITAVSARIPDEQEATLLQWKKVAAKLSKPAFGIALSLATFGIKQNLDEIGDAFAEAESGEVKDAAQNLWSAEKERKDAVSTFRELLISSQRMLELRLLLSLMS